MADPRNLPASRRGAWIINITKHLLRFDPTNVGLTYLENATFAGKAGSLLIKLSADDVDRLNRKKILAHARVCGINGPELPVYLEALKAQGCVEGDSKGETFEILGFSRERVLVTTSRLFLSSATLSAIEDVLPGLLEFCLVRPRLGNEVRDFLAATLQPQDAKHLLSLVRSFELLGVIGKAGDPNELFFNGYQFGDRAVKIGKVLAVLNPEGRSELNRLLDEVNKRPGTPPESITVAPNIQELAIGLGLVDVSEVSSPAGNARFLTSPRLAPPSVGGETEHLEDDVFHHGKMLLSSLRYGQLRSTSSRGRIIAPVTLVGALLNRDRIGPCTAIGQDYALLEKEGVVRTVKAAHKADQFFMELRRREPAEMVLGLLGAAGYDTVSTKALPRSLELPVDYSGPETSRAVAVRRIVAGDPESVRRFMETIRI